MAKSKSLKRMHICPIHTKSCVLLYTRHDMGLLLDRKGYCLRERRCTCDCRRGDTRRRGRQAHRRRRRAQSVRVRLVGCKVVEFGEDAQRARVGGVVLLGQLEALGDLLV